MFQIASSRTSETLILLVMVILQSGFRSWRYKVKSLFKVKSGFNVTLSVNACKLLETRVDNHNIRLITY